jgi:UDP-N-acetylglucosamine acyltransferase
MVMAIHPSALIDSRARIDPSVEIGPYVVIEGPVVIGPRTRVMAFAYFAGATTIGADNIFHPRVVVGHEPQDTSFGGGDTILEIGDRNVFREASEIHRGSKGKTAIGCDNYLMSHVHVGHDSRIGDHNIFATGATLGGHVEVDAKTFISGNCVVHQHVRVGRLSMMRGLSRAPRDVPPFCMLDETSTVRGLNRVGLRRAGFDAKRIGALQRAFARLFRVRCNLSLAISEIESGEPSADVRYLIDFIRTSERGVSSGPPRRDSASNRRENTGD